MLIDGVEFCEDAGDNKSPSYQHAVGSARLFRNLQLRSEDVTEERRYRAVEALCGYGRLQREAALLTRRWVQRKLPHAYPPVATPVNPLPTAPAGTPPAPYLYVTNVPECRPIGGAFGADGDGRAIYKAYLFLAQYDALPHLMKTDDDTLLLAQAGPLALGTPAGFPARPDEGDALRRGWKNTRYISKFLNHSPRIITLPNGTLKWVEAVAGERTAVPTGFPFTQFRVGVQYTWHNVPLDAVPRVAHVVCSNAVNSAEFDGYGIDTLLLSSFQERPTQGPLGDRLVDLEYRFIWQPNRDHLGVDYGWNGFPRTRAGIFRYWQVSSDGNPGTYGNTTKPFKSVDFSTLFRPDQVL